VIFGGDQMVKLMEKTSAVEGPVGLEDLVIGDIMKTRFARFKPDMTMEEAVGIVLKADANGGPVVGGDNRVVGFLSERDCLRLAMTSRINNSVGGLVRNYMRTEVVTVNHNESLLAIMDMFVRNWYHLYPVLDDNEKLVGVVPRALVLEEVDRLKQTIW
tara:strand:+ start:334 stop:810 length:477 start_codon:yes stop_codon:yes gene_type:complete